MALKFTEKLKNLEIPKVSASGLFGKKKQEESMETLDTESPQEKVQAEQVEEAEKMASSKGELQGKVMEYLSANGENLKKWYSDSQINDKIVKVAKKAGATIIYPVLLLYNLLKSPNTPTKDKMLIIGPLAYFVLPADLIPDVILGLGYTDDGLAVMTCIKTLASSITKEIQQETQGMCEELIGEVDEKVIERVSGVLKEKQDTLADLASKTEKETKKY